MAPGIFLRGRRTRSHLGVILEAMSTGRPTSALLRGLRDLDSHRGQIAHVEHTPARPAQEGRLSRPMPAALAAYLGGLRLSLWSHQAETIEAVRRDEDVILTTATASGKTLAFNLAVLEALHGDPSATALYLYPTKALANDQLSALDAIAGSLGANIAAAVYDGDTPRAARRAIRSTSRLVITNPYGLHEYLPNHHLWGRFLSNLRLVVLDEAHFYRGVLGSNVALVIRRLRRLAVHYGADPRFVLASATIANPSEHAENLLGRPARVLDEDGSPQGPKDFVCWNARADPSRSTHMQAADLLAHFATNGNQAICFTVSRNMAEQVARWAAAAAPSCRIGAYRAGYRPEDRRQIEDELRRGTLDAVAATSALELGIDIGRMDAVVIAGYPGTICSTRQQAGRAGRSQAPSIAVLVAFEDPLDQYLVNHPEELFRRAHEHAVVDLANPHILAAQLICAAAELPLVDSDAQYFGPQAAALITPLAEEGLVARTPMGYAFHGAFRPASALRLDALDDRAVEVRCGEELLEAMSGPRALADAHPGAILVHRGRSWRIDSLDLEAGIARAVAEDTDRYTETLSQTRIQVLAERRRRQVGVASLCLGGLRTSRSFYAYRLKSRDRVLATNPLDLPAVEMDTIGVWLSLPPELEAIGNYAGGLHGAEHALIHMMPLLAMCDRRDVAGMSTCYGPEGVIYIFDDHMGGVGIAEKVFERFERLSELALGLLERCGCDTGCPSCVYDRRCGTDNAPMDRVAAAAILGSILRPLPAHSFTGGLD